MSNKIWYPGLGPHRHGPYLLDAEDYKRATACAEKRRSEARKKGLKDKHNIQGKAGLKDDIVGAAGEIAAARALWCPWEARVNTFKDVADLGNKTEVRTTTIDKMAFWLTPTDPLDAWHIFMTQPYVGLFVFVGWIPGTEAKEIGVRAANPRRPGWSWWVSQDKLYPLREFPFDDI